MKSFLRIVHTSAARIIEGAELKNAYDCKIILTPSTRGLEGQRETQKRADSGQSRRNKVYIARD